MRGTTELLKLASRRPLALRHLVRLLRTKTPKPQPPPHELVIHETTEHSGGPSIRDLVAAGHPFLLRGLLPKLPCFRRFQPDVLASAWGDRLFSSFRSRRDTLGFEQESSTSTPISCQELINKCFFEPDPEWRFYCRNVVISPHMLNDLNTALACGRPFSAALAWVGEAGNITPMHGDYIHGFLGQTRGRKRIILVDPQRAPLLGLPHLHTAPDVATCRKTRLPDNLRPTDIEQLPPHLNIELNPGEILYIPPGWMHHVESLTPGISMLARYELTQDERRAIASYPHRAYFHWIQFLAEIGWPLEQPAPQAGADPFELWDQLDLAQLDAAAAQIEVQTEQGALKDGINNPHPPTAAKEGNHANAVRTPQ